MGALLGILLLAAGGAAEPAGVANAAAASAAAPAPKTVLARAHTLFEGLEYDAVIPLAEAVLATDDATLEERLDASLLAASCLAILGDEVAAERPFRLLLRARPDFELAKDTPPKILAVFRKVQADERELAAQVRELERQRAIAELVLGGEPPENVRGGTPLAFEYTLRDPRGSVSAISVKYRRVGESRYSSLALENDGRGTWRASLPGQWTANETGFFVQYFLVTEDARGQALLTRGDEGRPLQVAITPGELEDATPFYATVWFWGIAAAAVAATTVAGYLIYRQGSSLPPTDLGEVPYR